MKSTTGKKKTYRITFTNGSTFDYDVYDGEDGSSSEIEIVTSWNSTTSDEKVPSEKLSKTSLDAKAPTSHASTGTTYGLGTTSNYGHVKTINDLTQSSHSNGAALSAYQGYVLKQAVDGKANSSHTHTVSNITDFPTIPSKTSDLTNDGDGTNAFLTQHQSLTNYIQKSSTSGLVKNDGTIDTTSYSTFSGSYNDLTSKPTIPSKTSDLSNDSNFATTTNVSDSITAHNSNTSAHNLNKSQNIAFGTVGGTTSAFTVSLTGVTLTEGTVIALYNAIGSNVANATLNVNGLGAKPLYNQASAIPASRFPNKSVCLFVYNTTIVSTGCWQIIYSYGANSTYSKATTTPIADTSAGAVGTINKYALADHSHPQSSLYAEASHSHTKSQITDLGDYVETSAIANNLTTTSSGYVLDARQGKALADLIGDAIVYINQ